MRLSESEAAEGRDADRNDFSESLDDTYLGRDNVYLSFGDIVQVNDGSLCAAGYLRRGVERQSYLFRSRDDG